MDFFEELSEELQTFIAEQKMFFVATAPQDGRINLSPKGMDTFRCLDARTVGYLDVTGSGNETSAHLHENGRVTMMFCSFSKKPKILRLYGHGRSVQPQDEQWEEYSKQFEILPGVRQIILMDIDSVQTSCGYGVPVFDFVRERDTLLKWSDKKGPEGLHEYRQKKNRTSIDGLNTGLHQDPVFDRNNK